MKAIEITETELRSLIFWATIGVQKSRGGSYQKVVEFIKSKANFMHNNRTKYKNLKFGNL